VGSVSRRRERWARRENVRRQARYRAALARWRRVDDELARMLAAATGFDGYPAGSEPGEIRLILRPGERLFCRVPRAAVVRVPREPGRRGRVQYSSLDTARLAALGGLRRTRRRLLETGPVTVTDQRVVLHGPQRDREWPLARLADVTYAVAEPLTLLRLRDPEGWCGLVCARAQAPLLRFMLALARAHAAGEVESFVSRLRADRAVHRGRRPVEPRPVGPGDAPGPAAAALSAVATVYLGRPGQPLRWRIAQCVAAVIATAGPIALAVPHWG
jgi:hypothetical protein